MPTAVPRLEVALLNKTFAAMQVLHDVELAVLAGEVHGLAGQNGSGKSTLIKILTGVYQPDAGARYRIDGLDLRLPVRWREAHAAGVSVVHQDLGLLDQLSVAENVCVGGFPTRSGRIDRRRRDRLTERTLARLGVDIEPARLVGTLSAAERAEVAIARALRDHASGSGVIILDEATRALGGEDLARIHALLRRVTADGAAVLLISHSLPELRAVTDRITVLRDGRVVGAGLSTTAVTEAEIARHMLGHDITPDTRRTARAPGRATTLRVRRLTGRQVTDLHFTVAAGEILGVTGLPGTGFEEIPALLAGVQRAVEGELHLDGTRIDLRRAGVAACIRAGIMLVPERRDRDGLAYGLSVRDNISLPALRRRGRPWFVARRWQHDECAQAVSRLDIRPPAPARLLVKQLSGGNQQKVLLAKWFTMRPKVLVLHEPTQAVDVGARRDILDALRDAAASGVAVILVSSQPEDLVASCDRVLIHQPGAGMHEADASSAEVLIDQIYAAPDLVARS